MSPTHLLNKEWDGSYCGLTRRESFRMTGTLSLVTCQDCYTILRICEALRTVTPEQLIESEET